MEFFVLLAAAVIIWVILGGVAFFQGLGTKNELERLRTEVSRLRTIVLEREASDVASTVSKEKSEDQPAAAAHTTQREFAEKPEPLDSAVPVSSSQDVAGADPNARHLDQPPAQVEPDETAQETKHQSQNNKEISGKHFLSGNALIWIGGAALILGGAFLVKAAVDAGFFGPIARIISALMVGAGLIFFGEKVRSADKRLDESEAQALRLGPAVLAGAGAAIIYGAIYAAYGLYQLIPAILALVLLAGASAGMVALAVVHRASPVAGVGLAAAFISPALTATGSPNAPALFGYCFMVALAGFAVIRLLGWRPIAIIVVIGGLAWPALWLIGGSSDAGAFALTTYLFAFAALAIAFGWDEADPEDFLLLASFKAFQPALQASYASILGVSALATIFILETGFTNNGLLLWVGLCLLFLAVSYYRTGFSGAPLVSVCAIAFMLAVAPDHGVAPDRRIFTIGVGFAALFALGGYIILKRHTHKTPAVLTFTFAPVLFLAALFLRVGALEQAYNWGIAAFALSLLNFAVLTQLKAKAGNFDRYPGAASTLAIGVSLTACLAVAMSTEGIWMSAGFAYQAPLLALLWTRFKLPALKYAAASLAALATFRLFFLSNIFGLEAGPFPVINWLTLTLLGPAVGFWVAARLFEKSGVRKTDHVVQGLEAGAIVLGVFFVNLQIRHALNAGDLSADYRSLMEISLQSLSWIFVAIFMRWRFFNELTAVRLVIEKLLLAGAALQTVFIGLIYLNPWWGAEPARISGPPILNELFISYACISTGFAIAAWLARRAGLLRQAQLAGGLSLVTFFVYAVLVIRHLFHGEMMNANHAVSAAESWVYSFLTLAVAVVLVIASAIRRSNELRLAGSAALMAAVVKVFIFDLAGLEGVWRATSFLGLGLTLVGIAVLYQRILAPRFEAPQTDDA